MSASWDRSQNFKFVYSNIYTVYKTGQGHEGFLAAIKNAPSDEFLLKGLDQKKRPSLWARFKKRFFE